MTPSVPIVAYLAVDSTSTVVGLFRLLLVRRFGTCYLTSAGFDSFRQFFFIKFNILLLHVTSALEMYTLYKYSFFL